MAAQVEEKASESKVEESQPTFDTALYNVEQWAKDNEQSFKPPICNKLMYSDQLKIMFVGGPNTRKDFHIDCGAEFFYMIKGNMILPIHENGKIRPIHIKEGHVFLLPGCIPHSPQRPEKGSLGLVVERTRLKTELDGLRWYCDDNDTAVLWEKYWHCTNLGTELVPIVKEYMASEEFKSRKPTETSVANPAPVTLDTETTVNDPFPLRDFIDTNKSELSQRKELTVATGPQTVVKVLTGPFERRVCFRGEIWVWVLKGSANVVFDNDLNSVDRKSEKLSEQQCLIVGEQQQCSIFVPNENCEVMTITMVPSQAQLHPLTPTPTPPPAAVDVSSDQML